MFDRVLCLNLDRRPQRWEAFCERLKKRDDWPFPEPERYSAIDGKEIPSDDFPPPERWKSSPGARGCFLSHRQILGEIAAGTENVLILEDDAFCVKNFSEKVTAFLDAVPDDWDQIYLGGQHLQWSRDPRYVNDQVVTSSNVNRTHAYAVTPRYAQIVFEKFSEDKMIVPVDHQYGTFHKTGAYRIYCPHQWLMGQVDGYSDIVNAQLNWMIWENKPKYRKKGATCYGT